MNKLLKIDLSVVVDLGLDLPEAAREGLASALSRVLNDYSDGRHGYGVELLRDGLERAVRQACHRAVAVVMSERHPHEMVQVGPSSLSSRSHVEEMKVLEGLHPRSYGDSFVCRGADVVEPGREVYESPRLRAVCGKPVAQLTGNGWPCLSDPNHEGECSPWRPR